MMGKTAKYQTNTGSDRSFLTVFGRSYDDSEEETTSLLSKEHHLTQPRRRRGSTPQSASEKKATMSSWTFEHTFGYPPEGPEEDVVKKPTQPAVVLDAGWNLSKVTPIVIDKSERCLENHPLLPGNMWEFEHGAVCSMCNKNVGFDGGLMSCRDCNWDICPDCNELRKI